MVGLALHIATFAERHSIADLKADDENIYTLTFDDELEIRCFENFDLIHLVAHLERLPEQDSEMAACLRKVLNYALMRMKYSRATPVLDEDNRLLLFERFMADTSNQVFEEKIEQFVNVLEGYRHFLGQNVSIASLRADNAMMMFRP